MTESKINILIIGSGGREHALAWRLARSPKVAHIFVAPGNAGTIWPATDQFAGSENITNIPINAEQWPTLVNFAREHQIGLTIVGPEDPLAAGIVDHFLAAGLRIFGPTQKAAAIESSKVFSKQLMKAHHIPTAHYAIFQNPEAARQGIREFKYPLVIKADGLAAGKGVFICQNATESEAAIKRLMIDHDFGNSGATIVIEEFLSGKEVSILAFSDGKTVIPMLPARDHKRLLDGDQGPNTGGMGAYAPVPDIDAAQMTMIERLILRPTIEALAQQGIPFVGVLYAGLMMCADGPRVLEYNCRFGDPETQVILPLLETDLLDVLFACTDGTLDQIQLKWREGACATVVLASPGYPDAYPKGLPISGLDNSADPDLVVFHAGTSLKENLAVTAGGRVLAVTALGADLASALQHAYAGIEKIHFDRMQYRHDIGHNAGITLTRSAPVATNTTSAYAAAGVDIDAGSKTVDLISRAVKSTYGPQVLAGIGSFGGLYDGSALKGMNAPVLVASTDGVGTKTKVAARLNRWDTIGRDLVNHCINDILVQGGQPLFFLDYVASSKLYPELIATVVIGIAEACREAGCALLGGETAEMPGVYQPGEIDLVGTIVGTVDRQQLIDGKGIQSGDVLLGLPSTGLHTNGFSLARRILDGLDWTAHHNDLGTTIGEALLAVHRCYLDPVHQLQKCGVEIRGLAHITGGGLIDNLPRIFPAGLVASIQRGSWPVLPIFTLIQQLGQVDEIEMYRVFNMGIGMVVIVSPQDVERAKQALPGDIYVIGEMGAGVTEGQARITISGLS